MIDDQPPLSWDAEGPIQDVTDEDGQTTSGSPISNVWRVQAHQASAVSCLRWNPVDAQTVSIVYCLFVTSM
jgi:hypothetical protein